MMRMGQIALLLSLGVAACDTPPDQTLRFDGGLVVDVVGPQDQGRADSAADGASPTDVGGDKDVAAGEAAETTDQAIVPDAAPLYPTNGWIAFESNREDGRSEIYLMRADGTDVRRLTQGGGMQPRFSPDGRWIVYEDPADHSSHVVHPDGSGDKRLHAGKPWFWMTDGTGLVVQVGNDFLRVDPDAGTATQFFSRLEFSRLENKVFQPAGITADGRYVVAGSDRYRDGFTGDNGSFKASFSAIVLDLQDKSKLYFFGNGCAPRTAPAGDWIYHVRGDGDTHPDIYHMRTADLATRASYSPVIDYPDTDWGHTYFPQVSNDNQWLVFGASTGCHDQSSCDYEIFIHRLDAPQNQRERLTYDVANDRSPSLFVGDLGL